MYTLSLQIKIKRLSSVGPLANKKSLVDAKALYSCNKYAEHREGMPNAVVNGF